MSSFLNKFLDNISNILEYLNSFNKVSGLDPFPLVLFSILFLVITSISNNIYIPLITLTYSILLLIILRPSYRIVWSIEAYVLLLALIPSLPLLFTSKGYVETYRDLGPSISLNGIYSFTLLFMRVAIAPLPVIIIIAYLNWYRYIIYLFKPRLLNRFKWILLITITAIPRITRYVTRLLLSRSARIFREDRKTTWYMLTTVMGDLFIRSSSYSVRLGYSIAARSFTDNPWDKIVFEEKHVSRATVIYILLSTIFLAIMVIIDWLY